MISWINEAAELAVPDTVFSFPGEWGLQEMQDYVFLLKTKILILKGVRETMDLLGAAAHLNVW